MRVLKSGYHEHTRRRKPNARIGREAPEGLAEEAFERHRMRHGHWRINGGSRKADVPTAKGAARRRRAREAVEAGDPGRNRGTGARRRPEGRALDGRRRGRPGRGGTAPPRCRHGRVPREGGRPVDAGPRRREAPPSVTAEVSGTPRRRPGAASARAAPRNRHRDRGRRSTTPRRNRSSRHSRGSR